MTKQDFLDKLKARLSSLPKSELEERLNFYDEMIDDRIEEGLSEEEAVSSLGSADEIATQILSTVPQAKNTKSKERTNAWTIVLLVLGFPLWFSLIIAAFSVIISLYVTLWSVIISLWAVFVSIVLSSIAGIASSILFLLNGNRLTGIAIMGASIFCIGFSVLLFFICKALTKGTSMLTGKIALSIKNCFKKRRDQNE